MDLIDFLSTENQAIKFIQDNRLLQDNYHCSWGHEMIRIVEIKRCGAAKIDTKNRVANIFEDTIIPS